MRVIEAPALREELRQEQSRAAAAEAKVASIEAQVAGLNLSLAEARQALIDKEQVRVSPRTQDSLHRLFRSLPSSL